MVIERDKDFIVYVFAYAIVYAFLLLIYRMGFDLSLGLAFLINTPVLVFMIVGMISTGRRFVLDAEGCTVFLGKYQKHYIWSELKTKRIEKHDLPSMLRGKYTYPYLNEAILSPYIVRKPRIIRADIYSLFHPLSCIYIHFTVENVHQTRGRYYEVDEALFRQKLFEWGVGLDEK